MSNQLATSKFNTYPKLDKQCLQPPPLGSEAHPFSSIITTIPLPFFFLPCPLFFSPWCSIFTQGLDLPCGWLANMLNSTVGTIYLRGLEAKAEWAPFPDTCLFVYSITSKAADFPASMELMYPHRALLSGGMWGECSQLPLPPIKAALTTQPFSSVSVLARESALQEKIAFRDAWGEGTWISGFGERAWTWSRTGVTAGKTTGFPSCLPLQIFCVQHLLSLGNCLFCLSLCHRYSQLSELCFNLFCLEPQACKE